MLLIWTRQGTLSRSHKSTKGRWGGKGGAKTRGHDTLPFPHVNNVAYPPNVKLTASLTTRLGPCSRCWGEELGVRLASIPCYALRSTRPWRALKCRASRDFSAPQTSAFAAVMSLGDEGFIIGSKGEKDRRVWRTTCRQYVPPGRVGDGRARQGSGKPLLSR